MAADDGGSLARPRRAGGEDGLSAARGGGGDGGEVQPGVPGLRSRAHGRADAGLHADQRGADPAPLRDLRALDRRRSGRHASLRGRHRRRHARGRHHHRQHGARSAAEVRAETEARGTEGLHGRRHGHRDRRDRASDPERAHARRADQGLGACCRSRPSTKQIKKKFSHGFRPEVLEGNMRAIQRAYEEVVGE